MSNPLPQQLQVPEFRFFLVSKNKKSPPIEKSWNSTKNYMFFEPKLINHILKGGNVGVCTGEHGKLIVIDFDDERYQNMKERLLPKTFTVKTAGKGLHHLYYILKEEKMISKIGIGMEKRICDIQAGKCGVICPPSQRNGKYYSVVNDIPIAQIDCNTLSKVFGIKQYKESRKRVFKDEVFPEKIQATIDILVRLGVPRLKERHFRCPFHNSANNSNLVVFNPGDLYCFHCMTYWKDVHKFVDELDEFKKTKGLNTCSIIV